MSAITNFGWSDVNTLIGKGIAVRDEAKSVLPDASTLKPVTDAVSHLPDATTFKPVTDAVSQAVASTAREAETSISPSSSSPHAKGDSNTVLASVTSMASWVISRIPLPTSSTKLLRSSINPAFPVDDILQPASAGSSSRPAPSSTKSSTSSLSTLNTARLLFGSGGSSKSASPSFTSGKGQKFDRERFYVALCKKLYDEGL